MIEANTIFRLYSECEGIDEDCFFLHDKILCYDFEKAIARFFFFLVLETSSVAFQKNK